LDKITNHILLSTDAADGHITKSKQRKTTVFLPKNSENLIPKRSSADTNFLRQILLCSSVEGLHEFEWITPRDKVRLTSLCGLSMTVIYRRCSLYLHVNLSASEQAVYTLEEWIATDKLVIWELRTLVTTERSSEFLGVSRCQSSGYKMMVNS